MGIPKEDETVLSATDLCCKQRVSAATLCIWKAQYRGMDASETKRPKDLEVENARLRSLLADAIFNKVTPKDLPRKPGAAVVKRQAIAHIVKGHGRRDLRACRVIGRCRLTGRRELVRRVDAVLRERPKELA